MTDSDDALIAKSEQVEDEALASVERRKCDRRAVGEKTACPWCGWLESEVRNCRLAQAPPSYRRPRRCLQCDGEYTTIETVERATRPGKKIA